MLQRVMTMAVRIPSLVLGRRFALAAALAAGTMLAPLAAAPALAATLNVLQSEAPRSMDPGDQTATFTSAVLDPMYEGLTRRNSSLKLEPALATEWKSDDAGLVWTFKLRSGVTFHDGTPFNADAVVKNFERHLDTKRGLAASGRVRSVLAGVKAIDDMTVEFTLKGPYPAFLALLTTGPCLIVSPKADAAGTVGREAVGTGPYKLVEYKSGEYVLEAKFPGYWGKPGGTDQIKWTWSPEQSVLNMAVQSGDVDVVNPLPPIFAKTVEANPALKLSNTDGSAVFWVALNAKLKPLDDVRVRQALNFATDKPALVQAIMTGFAKPANSPLAPVTPGYDAVTNPYPYDLAKAKDLLKQAGVPDGFSMSVAVQEPEARIAEVLQGMWAKAGVKLEVRKMEAGVWSKAAFAKPEDKDAAGTGSVLASWSSGVNGADLQLRPLYHTASWAPTSANLGFYSSAKLDGLIDKAASTLDETARNALYGEAQKVINEDAPMVLLYYKKDLFAYRANVSGLWVVPGGQVMVRDAVKP
jgi:glutathione transport system substrate-binding protein